MQTIISFYGFNVQGISVYGRYTSHCGRIIQSSGVKTQNRFIINLVLILTIKSQAADPFVSHPLKQRKHQHEKQIEIPRFTITKQMRKI